MNGPERIGGRRGPFRRPPRQAGEDGVSPFERLVLRTPSRFRRRMVAGAAVAVVVLAAVSGLLAWRQYRDDQHRAVSDLNDRVLLVGAVVDSYLAGGISALDSVAAAPSVVTANVPLMCPFFKRVQSTAGQIFTGGVGWIDTSGTVEASSSCAGRVGVADRTYFRKVMATHKPYVSAGLIGRQNRQGLIVIAVPSFDDHGSPNGVVTGAIRLKTLGQSKQNEDLGFEGLTIIDRDGQLLLSGLGHVGNRNLLTRIEKLRTGDVRGTSGFDGGSHHVVAFATATVPDWTIAIDRSESTLYASARRSLVLELSSLGAAVLLVLAVLAFLVKRSRREIIAQGEQVQSWSRLTHALAAAASPSEVADALLDSARDVFPDAVVVVSIATEPDDEIRAASALPGWRRVSGDAGRLRAIAALTGDGSRTRSLEREKPLRDLYLGFGRRLKALHNAPILDRSGAPIGGISLLTERGRLAPSEWQLLGAFVDQAARALERARVYEHEHELAVRLQQSLLPDRLPSVPGISLAGEYLAGGAGIEVGGDWYDAVRRPDGILQLCVGDVSGRGIAAATVMGRERNIFRAHAYDLESPAEILRRMLRHVNDDEMVTAACVSIDPLAGEISYSCAGHPPPLLHDVGTGEVTRLEHASAPPLGVAEPGDIVEAVLDLPERARLAMYTDGLVERRGKSIEDGIDVLGRTISNGSTVTAQQALTTVAEAIGAPSDDVALLVAAVEPIESFAIELPAEPGVLPSLRRRVRAWLTRRDFDAASSEEIVLALSEACNNAIEHAYAQPGGVIGIEAQATDALLRIEVVDAGCWRINEPDDQRGRGLLLMESLMDRMEVETTAGGTRISLERRRNPVVVPAS